MAEGTALADDATEELGYTEEEMVKEESTLREELANGIVVLEDTDVPGNEVLTLRIDIAEVL